MMELGALTRLQVWVQYEDCNSSHWKQKSKLHIVCRCVSYLSKIDYVTSHLMRPSRWFSTGVGSPDSRKNCAQIASDCDQASYRRRRKAKVLPEESVFKRCFAAYRRWIWKVQHRDELPHHCLWFRLRHLWFLQAFTQPTGMTTRVQESFDRKQWSRWFR